VCVLDGILGTGIGRQEAQAHQCVGTSRVHAVVRALPRAGLAGVGEAAVRDQLLRSVVTFINGLTASAVASQSDWPGRAGRRPVFQ
jgi:hypothetical protein